MVKNRLEDFGEEPKRDNEENLIEKFSKEHPEINMRIIKADTPKAKKAFAEMYMNMRPKHPEQIIAYETEMEGPYTKEQWPTERAFIVTAFKRGMFNKMLYDGPFGGAHTSVKDEQDLKWNLHNIDDGFERQPNGTLRYSLGMNLEVQGYDSKNQRLITENDFRKFKGIR